jgi:hypothetical protein
MRMPFRPDAIAFKELKNNPGRHSGVNLVMYFDLSNFKT